MIKAILKFIGTFAIIAVFVSLVTVGVMFVSTKINPDKPIKIFGFSYCEFNENYEKVLSQYGNSTFSSIEINVKNINVEVVGSKESAMHLDVYNKMWGIAKLEEGVIYGTSFYVSEGKLIINVKQANGFYLNTANTSLRLIIPKDYSAKTLTINSNNGSISIGNSDAEYLNLADVELNTKSSKINIRKTKSIGTVTKN